MAQEEIKNEAAPTGTVRNHSLTPLTGAPATGEAGNMDILMDVSVPVVAQLGTTEVKIRDILRMAPGSIVELDKLAGEPVDLLVRGQIFAQGEVVVVDDTFGVRITQVLGQPNANDKDAG